MVFAVGVEQGIILAIVLSILEIIRRTYTPKDFLVGVDREGETIYVNAEPGHQSLPGLLVFRFDARLFFANANRFSDQVQSLLAAAPTKVRWLVLDCSSLDDVDYSASLTLAELIKALHADGAVFALAGADPELLATLKKYGTLTDFDNTHIYPTVEAAVAAFRTAPVSRSPKSGLESAVEHQQHARRGRLVRERVPWANPKASRPTAVTGTIAVTAGRPWS